MVSLRLCENGRITFSFTYKGSKTMKKIRTLRPAANGVVIVKGTGKWNDCFEFQTDNPILWGQEFPSTGISLGLFIVNYSKEIFCSIFYFLYLAVYLYHRHPKSKNKLILGHIRIYSWKRHTRVVWVADECQLVQCYVMWGAAENFEHFIRDCMGNEEWSI